MLARNHYLLHLPFGLRLVRPFSKHEAPACILHSGQVPQHAQQAAKAAPAHRQQQHLALMTLLVRTGITGKVPDLTKAADIGAFSSAVVALGGLEGQEHVAAILHKVFLPTHIAAFVCRGRAATDLASPEALRAALSSAADGASGSRAAARSASRSMTPARSCTKRQRSVEASNGSTLYVSSSAANGLLSSSTTLHAAPKAKATTKATTAVTLQ